MKRLAFVLVLVAACGSDKDKTDKDTPARAKTADPAAGVPAKPKQPLTAALFGKVVAPPGPLAQLEPGMLEQDAEKQLDAANEQNDIDGVHWWLGLGVDQKLGDRLVEFPTAKRGVVAEAWGPGQDSERAGSPVTVWFNPDTGIRAELSDDKDHSTLRFEPYTPLVKLLGDGPQIAMLSKPVTGLTQDDLVKAYPELADKGGKYIRLPPTEWEFASEGINVSPYPTDGRPVESVAFSIPFNKKDAAKSKADILAAIEKKWGKPNASDELDPKTKIYNQGDSHFEVSESEFEPDAITIRVSQPKAAKKH